MPKKLDRAPYILAHPGDLQGCGYYRVIRPMEILRRNLFGFGRLERNFQPIGAIKAIDPTTVLWQRHCEDSQFEMMKKYREALPDAFFVFELDDAMGAVPDSSWHKPYMMPDVERKIARSISICDAVTVTTEDLRQYVYDICQKYNTPKPDIRIAPNMLGSDDLKIASQIREKLRGDGRRPGPMRIVWGGGQGHAGDLALLDPVYKALGDRVEWKFIGMMPQMPDGTIHSHASSVPPNQYIAALAALDADVIIAPLEDNLFNRCKSNLRVLEAACCGAPVIASPVSPYLTDKPPIRYAATTQEWIDHIEELIPSAENGGLRIKQEGEKLRQWMEERYILDKNCKQRIAAWLPTNAKVFVPKVRKQISGIAQANAANIEDLCRNSSSNVFYTRDGVGEVNPARMRAAMIDGVACVTAATNDGGPAGFPKPNVFNGITPETAAKVADSCEQLDLPPAEMAVATGPAVLLSRASLMSFGVPDFERWATPEVAILEWSLMVRSMGAQNLVDLSTFVYVPQQANNQHLDIEKISMRIASRWGQPPIDDGVFNNFREMVELKYHREYYRYLAPPNRQDYGSWCGMHDGVGTRGRQIAREQHRADIAMITADTEGSAVPKTDWLFFLPDGAVPAEDWNLLIGDAIERNCEITSFYADHDFILEDGQRVAHDFKPHHPDLHLLLGRDYMSQGLVLRGEDFDPVLWDKEPNKSVALYTMILGLVGDQPERVAHIPRILTHLPPPRDIEAVTALAARKAMCAHTMALTTGWPVSVKPHAGLPIYAEAAYRLPDGAEPSVAIIIPTKNKLDMIQPCISTIREKTKYQNYEVFIIDNGSDKPEVLEYFKSLDDDKQVCILKHAAPYNWSELNNWAADFIRYAIGASECQYFLFLNDDTRVLSETWLDEMVACAEMPRVGAVGARLLYPYDTVQHVGVASSGGLSGHIHKGIPVNHPGYNGIAALSHESCAVTGACMLVRSDIFFAHGGFDEAFSHNFNDVDFCRRLFAAGLTSVVAAGAALQHYEGVTRNEGGLSDTAKDYLRTEGELMAGKHPEADPYWNPNLIFAEVQGGMAIAGLNYDMLKWPPEPRSWQADNAWKRVLVIGGDRRPVLNEFRDGDVVYTMAIDGIDAGIIDPPMENISALDLRQPALARTMLHRLGIDEVVFSALGNAPITLLTFLTSLGLPIVYRPIDIEAVCPRGIAVIPNADAPGQLKSCEQGWKTGACISCIQTHGTPHGPVTLMAWIAEWAAFLASPAVTIELDLLTPEFRNDFREYYLTPTKQEAIAAE